MLFIAHLKVIHKTCFYPLFTHKVIHMTNIDTNGYCKVTHNVVDIIVCNYVKNIEGFPFKSQSANCSFSYKIAPAAAIIAALSVQR